MALDDDIRILSAVGLFEGFTREQLRLLAFGAETTQIAAGRKLYREDDIADSAYVVVSGQIALYREGREQLIVGHVGPGAIMGELALISDTRRLTSASAEADTEILRLNRQMFRRILEEYPEVALGLHRRITAELQSFLQKIESMAPRFAG